MYLCKGNTLQEASCWEVGHKLLMTWSCLQGVGAPASLERLQFWSLDLKLGVSSDFPWVKSQEKPEPV